MVAHSDGSAPQMIRNGGSTVFDMTEADTNSDDGFVFNPVETDDELSDTLIDALQNDLECNVASAEHCAVEAEDSSSFLRQDTHIDATVDPQSRSVESGAASMCRARSGAVHHGRFAGFAHRGVKRLRVVPRVSQATTVPAVEEGSRSRMESDIQRRDEDDGEESSANTQSVGRDGRRLPENVEELPHESDSEEFASVISGAEEEVDEVEVEDVVPPRVAPAVIREAFRSLDDVNLVRVFSQRAVVMHNIPRCIRGPFRNAMRMALEEMIVRGDEVRRERGWKLFLLLLRLLLFRHARGGLIWKKKLEERFVDFAQGEWLSLSEASRSCAEMAATGQRRRRRGRGPNNVEKRAARAHTFVQLGELSSARQALEGADLALGNTNTLGELRRRPARPHEPSPPALMQLKPRPFDLDEKKLGKNLRSAKRGAAGGPSGMTTEHLRPLLDTHLDTQLLHEVCQQLARAEVSQSVINAIRMGRMTALSKPNGGVRGIVAGDLLRRLTARTMAAAVEQGCRSRHIAIPVRTFQPELDVSAWRTLSKH